MQKGEGGMSTMVRTKMRKLFNTFRGSGGKIYLLEDLSFKGTGYNGTGT
jgi:hypothetical protein